MLEFFIGTLLGIAVDRIFLNKSNAAPGTNPANPQGAITPGATPNILPPGSAPQVGDIVTVNAQDVEPDGDPGQLPPADLNALTAFFNQNGGNAPLTLKVIKTGIQGPNGAVASQGALTTPIPGLSPQVFALLTGTFLNSSIKLIQRP